MEKENSWIKISVAASTAGAIAAALTYTATSKATGAAAIASGLTVSTIGELASYGAKALVGEGAAIAVRLVTAAASKTTEETVRSGGILSAAVAGAAAGAAAALTVTVGGHVIKYSVEYGGKISSEMAQKFSEMYLMYKLGNNQNEINGNLVVSDTTGEWVLLEESSLNPIESSVLSSKST
jgi:hypothetical protein